ncbi:flagellar hook-basal body complex protein [Nibricoccus sp. IMCC34717]|uniref:flagellar hook-basal body complex protein n=1 Tax=Nibricoccus sp. IMCC34717 TaxID=3034021 RepID=UPI00384A8D5B
MPLIGTLTSGVSAMRAFTKNLEVIGNNIANVNTIAFKGSTVSFQDSFSNMIRSAAPANASGSVANQGPIQVGTGVQLGTIRNNLTQGSLSATGVQTDLGISGEGFFVVRNVTGSASYATRAGNFRFDTNGFLVNDQGYRIQGLTGGTASSAPSTAGDIQLATPPLGYSRTSFSIGKDGSIMEFYSNGTTNANYVTGQITLQTFKDPSALTKDGYNLYTGFASAGANTATKPGDPGTGTIQSGALELANVDLTEQFSDMITVQRSFQASSRLITVSDQILEDIVNLKR